MRLTHSSTGGISPGSMPSKSTYTDSPRWYPLRVNSRRPSRDRTGSFTTASSRGISKSRGSDAAMDRATVRLGWCAAGCTASQRSRPRTPSGPSTGRRVPDVPVRPLPDPLHRLYDRGQILAAQRLRAARRNCLRYHSAVPKCGPRHIEPEAVDPMALYDGAGAVDPGPLAQVHRNSVPLEYLPGPAPHPAPRPLPSTPPTPFPTGPCCSNSRSGVSPTPASRAQRSAYSSIDRSRAARYGHSSSRRFIRSPPPSPSAMPRMLVCPGPAAGRRGTGPCQRASGATPSPLPR